MTYVNPVNKIEGNCLSQHRLAQGSRETLKYKEEDVRRGAETKLIFVSSQMSIKEW